jgi:hypothetical protein
MTAQDASPHACMADLCSGPIQDFLNCNCHALAGSPDRCSQQLCSELESGIRECTNRNLMHAFQEVEAECDSQLDSFVRYDPHSAERSAKQFRASACRAEDTEQGGGGLEGVWHWPRQQDGARPASLPGIRWRHVHAVCSANVRPCSLGG